MEIDAVIYNLLISYKLLEGWRKKMAVHDIPFTEDLNIIKMLVDDPTIGEWNLQGLIFLQFLQLSQSRN